MSGCPDTTQVVTGTDDLQNVLLDALPVVHDLVPGDPDDEITAGNEFKITTTIVGICEGIRVVCHRIDFDDEAAPHQHVDSPHAIDAGLSSHWETEAA